MMWKATSVILLFAVLYSTASAEYCYTNVMEECSQTAGKKSLDLSECNAQYGGINRLVSDLQSYANKHIRKSFGYLLMSTHFANYEKSRHGFSKLYRKLSDSTWDDAIDLIKYIGKRGGKMDFSNSPTESQEEGSFELYELASMAKALDIEKELAHDAFEIHAKASRRNEKDHDPEITSFIENHFVHKHSEVIRDLAGHTNDLNKFITSSDSSLAMYLFDEYLDSK